MILCIAESKGKNISGIDGIKYIAAWRLAEINELTTAKLNKYKCSSGKRIYISKITRKEIPLKIPTLHDCIVQTLFKIVTLPVVEALSDSDSYGFRPGRCGNMVVARVASIFQSYTIMKEVVLNYDIKYFFDAISHKCILDKFLMPSNTKKVLKQ